MVAVALDSDIGHESHLPTTLIKKASRIAEMNPEQFRAILEIEAKLKAPPKPSNAPARSIEFRQCCGEKDQAKCQTRNGWLGVKNLNGMGL